MKNILFLASFIIISQQLNAQNTTNYLQRLPDNFGLLDVNGEEGPSTEGDFDKDGITDLAAIIFSSEDKLPFFCYFLSSTVNKNQTFSYCDWTFMMHGIDVENNVISVESGNGSMPIYGSMKLRYDSVKKDLLVYKYEDSSNRKNTTFKTGKLKN